MHISFVFFNCLVANCICGSGAIKCSCLQNYPVVQLMLHLFTSLITASLQLFKLCCHAEKMFFDLPEITLDIIHMPMCPDVGAMDRHNHMTEEQAGVGVCLISHLKRLLLYNRPTTHIIP